MSVWATGSGSTSSEAERLRAAGQLEEALALAEGELLPGLEDEWAFEARDEHRARTAAVLEQLAAASEAAGDLRRAADLSRRAAALEPLSEEAHRSLMRRLAAAGDRAAALTAFSELRTRLLQTLRVGPSEETRRIAESLRADAPAERVPAQLRRIDTQLFVGRTNELGRLAHLRDRHGEGVGIGLIAGEAGSGKTRLAARFAVDSAALGATVLYGCCGEEALVPYEPFADAVGESGLDAAALEERLAGVPGDRLSSCWTISSGPTGRRWRCWAGSCAATSRSGFSSSARFARTKRASRSSRPSPTCAATASSSGSSSSASASRRWRR